MRDAFFWMVKQLIQNGRNRSRHSKVLSPYEQCLHVARWIPRAFDMFCDLGEVIKVCLLLEEENNASDEEEDEADVSKRRKVILQRM